MSNWETGWDWDQGVGLYGIWKHYEATGDNSSFAAVHDWFTTRLPKGQVKHVNSMSVFATLVDLYKVTRNEQWIPYIEEWGYWAMYNLTRTEEGGMQHVTSGDASGQHPQQLWIDTLMMAALPLAKIGLLFNKTEYVVEAKKQFDIHIKYLYDDKNQLFFHGWTFIDKNNFAAAHWARGNAWAIITLTEMLELLGTEDDQLLLPTLKEVLRKLPPLQDLDNGGLWRTILDHPIKEGSYVETSASSGFLFAYMKAARKGWIAKTEYADLVKAGTKGVLANVASSGEVKNVSAGTGVGEDFEHYYGIRKIQTMWGQGMAVMVLMESWR
ncbi:glycoside hydrolase family 105 protein, partial [Periconia macrospinosa]